MEGIWYHIFYNELRVAPEEHPILLTEPQFNPKENREKTVEIMMETFGCPALYIANQAALGVYSFGYSSGLAVDIGEGTCNCVPVYEGHAIPHSTVTFDVCGRDLVDYFMKLLNQRGYSFTTTTERETARYMKENRSLHCSRTIIRTTRWTDNHH
eukprot:TRINITY_DN256_c0_g1_i2.p1 TRINITY_DN256_c0_g1~~TRINITY_DN256_c0_g1_i2.p1  ORF type:complete len:155 (+),score=11.14 TRINITY_DN256_c0_g1_i2:210-674(+)